MKNITILATAILGFLTTANAQNNVTLSIGYPANSTSPYYGLWTDTGISVTNGEWINVNAAGVWNWGASTIVGDYPDGTYPFITDDYFLGNSIIGSLIAFVGPDPFQGHTFGSFFPQPNYWQLGTSGQFASNTNGELWLGFNDDAQNGDTSDNSGLVTATVSLGFETNFNNPLILKIGQVSSNAFSFSISNGIPSTVCSIFDSGDLTHWTLIDSIMLDTNGSSMFATNSLLEISASAYPNPLANGFYTNTTGVPYRFYKVCDGQYISKTIGFVRLLVDSGTTNDPGANALIANQLDAPTENTLDGLFNPMPDRTYLPAGTVISKWNGTAFNNYTWNGSSWGGNGSVSLNPGEAAFLFNTTGSPIPVTFVGVVREGNSSLSIPGGQYSMVSSILPKAGYIQSTLGYVVHRRDTVDLWNGTGYTSFTYTSAGWSPSEPVLNVGEGVFVQPTTNTVWQESYSSHQF